MLGRWSVGLVSWLRLWGDLRRAKRVGKKEREALDCKDGRDIGF